MYLKEIEIKNFRNLDEFHIKFNKKLNVIYGENGQGKTSILEAIYLLTITKSFRTNNEKFLLNYSKENFSINGNFYSDSNEELSLRLYYSNNEGKHIFFNKSRIEKFSTLIGKFPVILLSLEDLELTYGLPSNRRKFVDIILSQVSPIYLQALQYYKKALLNRNKLLYLIYEKKESIESVEAWNEQLIHYGTEIIKSRNKFINFLNSTIGQYYREVSKKEENIKVDYISNIISNVHETNDANIKNIFFEKLSLSIDKDILRQSTFIGPHRDDFGFNKNGQTIKFFGSQGENKTFLIALKLSENEYLKLRKSEKPIFLLDDIFSELDEYRINNLIDHLANSGQTFITTTAKDKFVSAQICDNDFFLIKNGCIEQ